MARNAITTSSRTSAANPDRLRASTVTVYSTNAAARKTNADTAGPSPDSSTPRITSAPNQATGALRRSATGMKIAAMNRRTTGSLGPAGRFFAPEAAAQSAANPPTTQSSAIQWPGRIRFVSGGRGGRDGPLPGYAGYAEYADGRRSSTGYGMSRSGPTVLR